MAFLISSPEVPSSFSCRRTEPPARNLSKTHPRYVKCCASFRTSYDAGIGVRVRVRASVKDCEQDVNLHGQFSAPVMQGSSSAKHREEDEEKKNYYVNTGYAIRTLREEFPALFYRELNFDIYRDDIVFKDPLYTFAGIDNYKSIFGALRFHGKILFKALWVDIISVWQPVENVIMVRWVVHGIPRVPWESRGRFDGVSEYKLDKNGKIYEHRVHNIALNSPPKFQVLSVHELIQSIGCPSTPKPTFFEITSSYITRQLPSLVNFSWNKDHSASATEKCEAEP